MHRSTPDWTEGPPLLTDRAEPVAAFFFCEREESASLAPDFGGAAGNALALLLPATVLAGGPSLGKCPICWRNHDPPGWLGAESASPSESESELSTSSHWPEAVELALLPEAMPKARIKAKGSKPVKESAWG